MLSFSLNQQNIKDLKELQVKISKNREFTDSLDKETCNAIHRYAFISNLGASTRIENAVLTNNEIDWLDDTLSKDGRPSAFEQNRVFIEQKISKDKERSLEEVGGCREFLQLVYTNSKNLKPLTESNLRQLHYELLKYYSKAGHYAGQYKIAPNSVVSINHQTGERKSVLKTADPGPITKMAMQQLLDWYRIAIEREPWSIAVATEFKFRFLAIHPFQDGNGRLSRGLFLLALLQSSDHDLSSIVPYLSIDRSIEEHRQEYYLSLRQCSNGEFKEDPKEYQMSYLLNFIMRMTDEALEDIKLYYQKYLSYKKLTSACKQVLQVFKEQPEMRLKTNQLVNALKQPRRTLIYHLQQLTKKGFLQRQGEGRGSEYQLIF